ncbi:MAG: RagB/SusD family nutrient uptake outer membrane protein [Bacteroidia bacterium]|nr:RagB/SusD family nutrient uptake outer membrane protein [Bacteroidia bacterium]
MKSLISLRQASLTGILLVLLSTSGCIDALDRVPFVEITSATIYEDPANYKLVLAKLYAGLAVSGQQGPAGKPDISGIDEGFSSYLRQYWKAQQLPTDEAIIGWNDGNLRDYHDMDWTSSNEFVLGIYSRIYYQISLCNEFIRESTDEKLAARGIAGADAEAIRVYRAEARLLRAMSYWHALDMFANVPFVTEEDAPGAFLPRQAAPAELFAYIESELKAIEPELVPARQGEYGRADQAAAWMILAKLYLNAETYIGQPRYTEALAECNKVIAAGYSLSPNYRHLFLADNHTSPEIIMPIAFDGINTRTWGGMTFLVHAPVGGSMSPAEFGINGGWGGIRTTAAFVDKFADITGETDTRAMFYTTGQKKEIDNIFSFTNGYAITKYKNITSTGEKGSDAVGNFPDTDFPLFRLADVYLMYAEAVLRGGTGGDLGTALGYVNALRQRAYGNADGNVTELTLDFILDERSRELYWEGHRRTDLIRFGRYTGDAYIWPWKGSVKEGQAVSSHFRLYPIPSSDLVANPNLVQNPGY